MTDHLDVDQLVPGTRYRVVYRSAKGSTEIIGNFVRDHAVGLEFELRQVGEDRRILQVPQIIFIFKTNRKTQAEHVPTEEVRIY